MGLDNYSVEVIKSIINEHNSNSLKVASLGYPDLLLTPTFLDNLFGNEFRKKIKYRQDSPKIISRRKKNISSRIKHIPEAISFFKAMSCELDILDFSPHVGNETIIDLNQPCPIDLYENYDLIMDCGTLEHCFNIAEAMFNLARMTRLNGYIYHHNPFQMFNHGFINPSPTLYADFYASNGFEIKHLQVLRKKGKNRQRIDIPAYARFRSKQLSESVIEVVAKRVQLKDINIPTQAIYVNREIREQRKKLIKQKNMISPSVKERMLEKLLRMIVLN